MKKKLVIFFSVFFVLGIGFLVAQTDVLAQTSSCNLSNVSVIINPVPVTTVPTNQGDVEVLDFSVKNLNTGSNCTFYVKNIHLDELTHSSGSSAGSIYLYSSSNLISGFEKFSFFNYDFLSSKSTTPMSIQVGPNTTKNFEVKIASVKNSNAGGYTNHFLFGVKNVFGHFGTNSEQLSNLLSDTKWGRVFTIQN